MSDTSPGSPSESDPIKELADSFLARVRRGERPSVEDYAARSPELADEIRELLPALIQLEGGLSGSNEATGSHHGAIGVESLRGAPRQLGDYTILREVGRGGMGVVYEAVQQSLGRHVALKVLPWHQIGEGSQLERFRLEARSAAKLHHSNIVPVFGVGAHEGVHYYAMQFIRGQGLDAVIAELRRPLVPGTPAGTGSAPSGGVPSTIAASVARGLRRGRLETAETEQRGATTAGPDDPTLGPPVTTTGTGNASSGDRPGDAGPAARPSVLKSQTELTGAQHRRYFRRVARLALQVAEGLAYAHEQGILHRDIKPSNLLVDLGGTVWITDFGLAKAEGSDGPTRTGDIIGTLRYMAPERFEAHSDRRSDVYALGATLFELATLSPLFGEVDRPRLVDRILHEPPTPPRRLDRRVPRDLETIILKALAKEPSHRYQDAEAMAEELRRFVEDRPILTRRVGAAEQLWRWCRRNPVVAASTGLAAASLLAVAVISTIAFFRTRTALESAVEARRDADRNADRADTARAEEAAQRRRAVTTLVDMYTSYGLFAADRGDVQESVLWFAAAATSADRDSERERLNRLRLRNWVEAMAVPIHAARNPMGKATGLTIHPDNRHALIHTNRGTVAWDLDSGELTPHDLRRVIWSPDGSRMASAAHGGVVELGPFPGGEVTSRFRVPGDGVPQLAFSDDGAMLAAGNEEVRIWDLDRGAFVPGSAPHPDRVASIEFEEDRGGIVTCCRDGLGRVFDLTPEGLSGGTRFEPVAHHLPGRGIGLRFVPPLLDGLGRVLFRDSQHSLVAVDLRTGGRSLGFDVNVPVLNAAVDRRRRILAISEDLEGIVSTHDLRTGEQRSEIRSGWPRVPGIAFRPGDGTLASVGHDAQLRFYSPLDGRSVAPAFRNQGQCEIVAFSPDGTICAMAQEDQTIRMLRMPVSGGSADALSGEPSLVLPFEPSMDREGRWFTTSGARWGIAPRRVTVHETSTGRPAGRSIRAGGEIRSSVLSPDGRLLAFTACDPSAPVINQNSDLLGFGKRPGQIHLWDWQQGEPISEPIATETLPLDLAFSPDGTTLAVACFSGEILLVAADRQSVLATLRHHGVPDYGYLLPRKMVRYSSDGRYLVVAGFGKSVHIWSADGDPIALRQFDDFVSDLAFSESGRFLVTACWNGEVRVWDAATGEPLGEGLDHPGRVTSARFDPGGDRLVTTCEDGTARVWDWREARLVCPGLEHSGIVNSAAFNRDGTMVVTAADGEIRFWETFTGRQVAGRRVLESRESQLVMDDARTLAVVASSANSARLNLNPLDLAAVYRLREFDASEDVLPRHDLVRTFAEVVSARRIEQGGAVLLTSDEWMDRWHRLEPEMPGLRERLPGPALGDAGGATLANSPAGRASEFRRLGMVASGRGNWEEAIASYREAIRLDPGREDDLSTLGVLLSRVEAWDGAEDLAAELASLAPEGSGATLAMNNLAWMLVKVPGASAEAVEHAVRLARLAVDGASTSLNSGIYRNTLGVALIRAGRWQEAAEELEAAIELLGDESLAYNGFPFAVALARLGDRAAARSWYERSVAWEAEHAAGDPELASLRAEAEAALAPSASLDDAFPIDPFARER